MIAHVAPYDRPIVQYAWVVPDLEAAAHAWFERFSVGPFLVNADIRVDDLRYRGEAATLRFSTALAQMGDAQIELVQQLEEGPSAFRDLVPKGATGFHHVAVIATDYDAALQRAAEVGDEVAVSGRVGAMRYVYTDATATLGCMVEILESNAGLLKMFDRVRRAADGWDGTRATLLR